MRRGRKRPRSLLAATAGLALCASAPLRAQAQEQPPPPKPAPTTITEQIPKPAAPEELEHVPPDASGINLSEIDTRDLSLLYFDPAQTYFTPYLGRAFENALTFHKKTFHWQPWEPVTILLKDFGDYGNAAARSSPNDAVLLDVAPLSQTMETFTPGERFFTLLNHELAHVAQMDVWNRQDAFWRRAFHGKPMPIQEHPEIYPL